MPRVLCPTWCRGVPDADWCLRSDGVPTSGAHAALVHPSVHACSFPGHQSSSHDVEGTLIITASVTHKQAMLFAPFILNVDKGIRVFNKMFPDDAIKPGDATSMMRIVFLAWA